jgi:DNA-directed RNA polymerase subunit RPC12/RpoP
MKPRTKRHFELLEISNTLPEITDAQKEYGLKNCMQHIAYRSKKTTGCLDCGHVWVSVHKIKTIVCPKCSTRLVIEDTKKKKLDQMRKYMSILDVRGEYQIVRIIELFSYHKIGEAPRTYVHEVVRQFFKPDCQMEVVALNRNLSGYCDSFNGNLEIRDTKGWYGNKYDLWTDVVYPIMKVLPVYHRYGFKNKIDDMPYYSLFKSIMRDSKAETLIKARQFGLLALRVGSRYSDIETFWGSVKICIRNKYFVPQKDRITWLDYLHLLKYFNKDLLNAKYVCPKNLNKEHNILSSKKMAIVQHQRNWPDYVRLSSYFNEPVDESIKNKVIPLQRRLDSLTARKKEIDWERSEKQRIDNEKKEMEKISAEQSAFINSKSVFFDITFTNGEITVSVLQSIDEFFAEGKSLKHCVFTNEYYKRPDSLILSARIGDKSIETIEISLKSMKIIQSRGWDNRPSVYNRAIISLVNKNLHLIKDRKNSLRKVAA